VGDQQLGREVGEQRAPGGGVGAGEFEQQLTFDVLRIAPFGGRHGRHRAVRNSQAGTVNGNNGRWGCPERLVDSRNMRGFFIERENANGSPNGSISSRRAASWLAGGVGEPENMEDSCGRRNEFAPTTPARIPPRRWAEPEEIAGAFVFPCLRVSLPSCFLASDAASYITEQVLPVDGGMVM
jgi:hypothetical protein